MDARAVAPVFIVGSPRSGTTLLYHMLLSSGGFAVYHAEAHVFTLMAPRFGRLSSARNRAALLDAWLPSELFRRSGLEPAAFRRLVEDRCRSSAELLGTFMDAIVVQQGARRWAECTPENALFVREIARSFPTALFLHIVRDGRDVACSLAEQGWIGPRASADPRARVLPSALYWEWIVGHARRQLATCPRRALELRFERLLQDPHGTLESVGAFLHHELDYDRIRAHAVGTVERPNTSFPGDDGDGMRPIGRWRRRLSAATLTMLEAAVGDTLSDLGYRLQSEPRARCAVQPEARRLRRRARWRFASRLWLKTRTPAGRVFTNAALLGDFRAFDRDRLLTPGGNLRP